mmetsp:Transcript_20263/g.69850  ORF Transcript_20263/g.69850 Transcript_20263/m.69850 type:complete len:202 (-) Transcript_20263:8-613(-)
MDGSFLRRFAARQAPLPQTVVRAASPRSRVRPGARSAARRPGRPRRPPTSAHRGSGVRGVGRGLRLRKRLLRKNRQTRRRRLLAEAVAARRRHDAVHAARDAENRKCVRRVRSLLPGSLGSRHAQGSRRPPHRRHHQVHFLNLEELRHGARHRGDGGVRAGGVFVKVVCGRDCARFRVNGTFQLEKKRLHARGPQITRRHN